MTSLLTNNAAMTALTTLKSINTQLDATSNRVSTGQRVSAAADNAAYWSIATTVRTDNASLSAVKDSLGLGSSAVDTAYNGLNSILTDLQNLRAKLQTALQPGVDRSKVQTEISAIQSKMKATADSSVSSGQNWLSVNSSDPASYKPTQSIVAGFSRDSGGNINLSNVDVKVSTIALYDANTANRVDTPATTAMLTGSKALTGTIDFSGTNEVAFSIVSVIDANNTEGAKIVLNKDTLKTAVADLAKVTVNEVLDAINNQIAASGDANLRGKVKAALDNDGRLTFETAAGTNLGTDNAVGGTPGTAAADSVAAAGGSARTVTVQNVARSATGQVRLDIGFGVTAAPDLIAANSYNNIALTGTATTFTIDDGSGAQTVSLTNTSTNAAGTAPASYASVTGSEMAGLINKALTTAGSKASVSFDATSGKFVVTSTLVGTGASVTVGGTDFAKFGFSSAQTQAGTGAAGTTSTFSAQGTDAGTTQVKGILDTVDGSTNFSIQSIDLNALATGDTGDLRLKKVITQLDKAIAKVTDAGTQLGAKKTQVDGQKSFIDTLMKANDRTIGILVDADIEEESTKLKALQTQQQLAVQALSIANSSSQNVLSLFR